MSTYVNGEIARCLENGWITSATIMANGASFREAVEMARSFPQKSFGVHMNLTEFAPLSDARGLAKFCDGAGILDGRRFRSAMRLNDCSSVMREWSLQVQRVKDSGLAISHLDSHHHVHTVPLVMSALKGVQRAHGIRRVRKSRNVIPTSVEGGIGRRIKLAKKYVWNKALVSLSPSAATTDLFGSVTDFVLRSREVPPSAWNGKTIELMCHPGGKPSLDTSREFEWIREGLHKIIGFDIELITFFDIS